jgi:hypothetical protein
VCSKVLVTARGAGGDQAFGRPRLLPSLQDKTTSHTQSRTHAPPPWPIGTVCLVKPQPTSTHFHVPHTFPFITNAQDTRRRGGFQHFSTTIAVPKLFFSTLPPSHPATGNSLRAPPVLFIKVLPHPTLSPGLVMVSAKVMVRPRNFEREDPPKSQKDECRNGTNCFYQT